MTTQMSDEFVDWR